MLLHALALAASHLIHELVIEIHVTTICECLKSAAICEFFMPHEYADSFELYGD